MCIFSKPIEFVHPKFGKSMGLQTHTYFQLSACLSNIQFFSLLSYLPSVWGSSLFLLESAKDIKMIKARIICFNIMAIVYGLSLWPWLQSAMVIWLLLRFGAEVLAYSALSSESCSYLSWSLSSSIYLKWIMQKFRLWKFYVVSNKKNKSES